MNDICTARSVLTLPIAFHFESATFCASTFSLVTTRLDVSRTRGQLTLAAVTRSSFSRFLARPRGFANVVMVAEWIHVNVRRSRLVWAEAASHGHPSINSNVGEHGLLCGRRRWRTNLTGHVRSAGTRLPRQASKSIEPNHVSFNWPAARAVSTYSRAGQAPSEWPEDPTQNFQQGGNRDAGQNPSLRAATSAGRG